MLKIFAGDLKAVREEKNLSLRNIAQQTRLNITVLENIENGDFTFQPQAYIRAFLKQYISSIGLDVEDTLFDYDLARSGKYKSKRQGKSPSVPDKTKKEERLEAEPVVHEQIREVKEDPVNRVDDKFDPNENSPEDKFNTGKSEEKNLIIEKETGNKLTLKHPKEKKNNYSSENTGRKNITTSILNSVVFRNIALILFVILILLGIYSLINIMFFDGTKDNPEVIRQNFDDVVKEQEKKILGHRTPEEIKDSIKKAGEYAAANTDSITLNITAFNKGIIFLVTDSIDYNKPVKYEFEKNGVGVFKAKNLFFLSTVNTELFRITVNDKPVKFNNAKISKAKITRDGLSK